MGESSIYLKPDQNIATETDEDVEIKVTVIFNANLTGTLGTETTIDVKQPLKMSLFPGSGLLVS